MSNPSEVTAKFFMNRNEDGRVHFGCQVNRRHILFIPELEISDDGIFVASINPNQMVLFLNETELKALNNVFYEKLSVVESYYQVFVGSEWGPTPKSVYEKVLTLDLLPKERSLVESKLHQFTYIYLIKDNRTGYIKIGKSNSPPDRLKKLIKQDTLLPEPNDFELMFAWGDYVWNEKALHKTFANKRIRGEWFDLDEEDIHEIQNRYFNEKNLLTGKSDNEEYEEGLRAYEEKLKAEESKNKKVL